VFFFSIDFYKSDNFIIKVIYSLFMIEKKSRIIFDIQPLDLNNDF